MLGKLVSDKESESVATMVKLRKLAHAAIDAASDRFDHVVTALEDDVAAPGAIRPTPRGWLSVKGLDGAQKGADCGRAGPHWLRPRYPRAGLPAMQP